MFFKRFSTYWVASAAMCCFLAQPVNAQKGGKGGKPPTPTLTVMLNAATVVIGDTVTGTVTHNNADTSAAVTVTLSSSESTAVALTPNPVVIGVGENSAAFTITAVSGPQVITITAASNGYQAGSADLSVIESPLPAGLNVRYRITFPAPPANTTYPYINDLNNLGQVVGWYGGNPFQRAFLYDPLVDADQVFDLNEIVTAGLPDGWRLSSGVAINDWMVVVGYIEKIDDPLQKRAIAVDLAASSPVVDLLPDVGGDSSYGTQINENGDILGVYNGHLECWIFNPGLYGDPDLRVGRDGAPLDMSAEIPVLLPLSGAATSFKLNNPVGNRPAQIAGKDADGVAFRYTLGDLQAERFPELDLSSLSEPSLNDSGTFCGLVRTKGISRTPFRYSTELDQLPGSKRTQNPQDMNSSGDLILYDVLYRDDWGDRYVNIDDLVVGTDADLQLWFSGTAVNLFEMNDRAGNSDSGQIAGRLGVEVGGSILFLLTPEPASAP